MRYSRSALIICAILVVVPPAASADDSTSTVDQLTDEAAALAPLVKSRIAHRFLDAVRYLPEIDQPRTTFVNPETRAVIDAETYAELDDSSRPAWEKREYGSDFYYYTRYGSPLAFVRPLDLVGQADFHTLDGARVIDFGFGSIGQLRLMASIGATAVGIEVSDLLEVVYSSPQDTGQVTRVDDASDGTPGHVRLFFDHFPADTGIMNHLGSGYDIFFSKNTLKRGYIHPEREVDPRMLVHLGVDDSTFVQAVYDLLNPRGLFMIYNLHPAQNPSDKQYIPWADGRCPFDRELIEAIGFTVISFDKDDTDFAHRMAAALGWDEQMNLETDLFGTYTLLRK